VYITLLIACCVHHFTDSLLCTLLYWQPVVYITLLPACCVHYFTASLLCTLLYWQPVVYITLLTACCVHYFTDSLLCTLLYWQPVVYITLLTACCVHYFTDGLFDRSLKTQVQICNIQLVWVFTCFAGPLVMSAGMCTSRSDVCRYVYWLQWCYLLLGTNC
jgi:hypothetical protein